MQAIENIDSIGSVNITVRRNVSVIRSRRTLPLAPVRLSSDHRSSYCTAAWSDARPCGRLGNLLWDVSSRQVQRLIIEHEEVPRVVSR